MLPVKYEPLLLTFHDPKVVDDATVIGSDGGTELRLVRSAVVSVDRSATLPERFMNSSLDCVESCIDAHREYCRAVESAKSEAVELAAVDTFARRIHQIDSRCLDNPENWWSVIVEQMRNGQLWFGVSGRTTQICRKAAASMPRSPSFWARRASRW